MFVFCLLLCEAGPKICKRQKTKDGQVIDFPKSLDPTAPNRVSFCVKAKENAIPVVRLYEDDPNDRYEISKTIDCKKPIHSENHIFENFFQDKSSIICFSYL